MPLDPDLYQDYTTTLENILGDNAHYLSLKDNTKLPSGPYKHLGKVRHIYVPLHGHYGVIPRNRLVILDLDNHQESLSDHTFTNQLSFFKKIFGKGAVDSTLIVNTPSGGKHIYLYLPENIDSLLHDIFGSSPSGDINLKDYLPSGSIRKQWALALSIASKSPLIHLDADIRTGYSTGYTVGPFNEFTDDQGSIKCYQVEGEFDEDRSVSTMDSVSFTTLIHAGVIYKYLMKKTLLKRDSAILAQYQTTLDKLFPSTNDNSTDDFGSKFISLEDSKKLHILPKPFVLTRLRNNLKKRDFKTYHEGRAFVFGALHCCYSINVIASVCDKFGLNKDSYSDSNLSRYTVINDLKRITLSSSYHGSYCPVFKQSFRRNVSSEVKLENLPALQRKVHDREIARSTMVNRYIDPRVLHWGKISSVLLGDSRKKKVSQQYLDAMSIVDYFLNPLCNVGAVRFVLAYQAVSKRLGISLSRVRQALRVLRAKGVIKLVQRQRQGVSCTYEVSDDFVDAFLTRLLRSTWGNSSSTVSALDHRPVYFNRHLGVFCDVFYGYPVGSNLYADSLRMEFNKGIPDDAVFKDYKAGALYSYLREEAELLGYRVLYADNPDEVMVIHCRTGELLAGSSIAGKDYYISDVWNVNVLSLSQVYQFLVFYSLFSLLMLQSFIVLRMRSSVGDDEPS